LDKKANDVVLLEMRKASNFWDYFVVASAESTRKVRAIADSIVEGLDKKGVKLSHKEGEKEALWALLDYGNVVAHIFHNETRKFYNLERLWHEAPKEHIFCKCQDYQLNTRYPTY